MKIAVLGASVSHQTVKHRTQEMTGYCEYLRRHHLRDLRADSLVQLCYPGNRLSDGGLCRVDDVVAQRPALCIVEPLVEDGTRGQEATHDEACFVYARLLRAGIVPLTLFLPEPPRRSPAGTRRHALYRQLCDDAGLPTMTIDLGALPSIREHFEGTHTTAAGAQLYAQAVVQALASLGPIAPMARRLADALPRLASTIRVKTLAMPQLSSMRRLVLRLRNAGDAEGRVRTLQHQTVGPFSPVLDVRTRSATTVTTQTRCVWDMHCHYERRSYVVLDERTLPAGAECEVRVTVSAADPPYGDCRRAVATWPAQAERELRPIGAIRMFATTAIEARVVECG